MKLGFNLGPCLRDIILGKVKDEDVGFILVDDGFNWNNQPDGIELIRMNNLMLKQFDEQVVYNQIDILHFAGKLVSTTNNDISSFWPEFADKNNQSIGICLRCNCNTRVLDTSSKTCLGPLPNAGWTMQ